MLWYNLCLSEPYDIHKAAGIIIKDRRLLVERSKGNDVFVAPGDKLEPGETSRQAVIGDLEEFGTFYAEAAGSHNTGKKLRMEVYVIKNPGEIALIVKLRKFAGYHQIFPATSK